MDSARALALGLDIGGSSIRAVLVDLTGELVAESTGGGGNPVSNGTEGACARLAGTLRSALADVDPGSVVSAVAGFAGGGWLAVPGVADAYRDTWTSAGLRCPFVVASDLDVAFVSGTSEPDGTVLVAGTGAVAGAVRDRRVGRVSDGYGWLLGDRGSGFWLGVRAVRAALDELRGDGPRTLLTASVAEALRPGRPPEIDGLINVSYQRRPVELAALAPLVSAAACNGDEVAAQLCARAAGYLWRALRAVRADAERSPIVLAGGVATASAVARHLAARIEEVWPGRARSAGHGAAGAAWLALRAAPGVDTGVADELHQRVLATGGLV
jgi:N-acetylglucosamine kinase-like BadF-type ATPase